MDKTLVSFPALAHCPVFHHFLYACKASTSLLATLDEMGTRSNENKLGTQHCFFFFEDFYSPIQVLQVGGGMAA